MIGIARITAGDELLMMTARGKIQRIPADDVSIIGRNTQGVRFMSLDEGDSLIAVELTRSQGRRGGEAGRGNDGLRRLWSAKACFRFSRPSVRPRSIYFCFCAPASRVVRSFLKSGGKPLHLQR